MASKLVMIFMAAVLVYGVLSIIDRVLPGSPLGIQAWQEENKEFIDSLDTMTGH